MAQRLRWGATMNSVVAYTKSDVVSVVDRESINLCHNCICRCNDSTETTVV